MAETLLSICQAVSEEYLSDAPQSIIGNQDADAILLKRLVTSTCRELIREYVWQALKRTYTFTTVAGTSDYDLPTDWRSPVSLTFWNRTQSEPLVAASSIEWQALNSGIVVSGIRYFFVFEENQLKLNPTPETEMVIACNYYSNAFCESEMGDAKSDFSLDTDVCRLDGDLVIRGVKWRFVEKHGEPYAEYKADYVAAIDALQAIDTPKRVFNFAGRRTIPDNIPDGNFGI